MNAEEAARQDAEAWAQAAQLAGVVQSILGQLQRQGMPISIPTMIRALALQFAFAHLNNGLAIEGLEQLVRDALASEWGARLRAGIAAKGGPQTPTI